MLQRLCIVTRAPPPCRLTGGAMLTSRRAAASLSFSSSPSLVTFTPITRLPADHRLFSRGPGITAATPPQPPVSVAVVLADISSSRRVTAGLLLRTISPALREVTAATCKERSLSGKASSNDGRSVPPPPPAVVVVVRVLAFSTTTPLLQDEGWADAWRQHLDLTIALGPASTPGTCPLPPPPLQLSSSSLSPSSSLLLSPVETPAGGGTGGHAGAQQQHLLARVAIAYGHGRAGPLLGVRPVMPFLLEAAAADGPMRSGGGVVGDDDCVTVEFFRVDNFIPVQTQIQEALAHIRSNSRQRADQTPTATALAVVTPDHLADGYGAHLGASEAQRARGDYRTPCLLFNSRGLVHRYSL